MTPVTIHVQPVLIAHLRALAEIEGYSFEELVHNALSDYRDGQCNKRLLERAWALNTPEGEQLAEFIKLVL